MDEEQPQQNKPEDPNTTVGETTQPEQAVTRTAEADTTDTPDDRQTFDSTSPTEEAVEPSLSWSASEFIAHQKSPGWYVVLAGATAVLAGLIWLVTKDTISAIVVVVAGVFLGACASRKPRQITYTLSDDGIEIDGRKRFFAEFRSFSVVPEGAFSSIVLLPHKRFGLITALYYDPADENQIVNMLSYRVPHQEHHADMVEQLMRRIRF